MTLYHWMHWFWITFHLTFAVNVQIVQSQPTLMSSAVSTFINESPIPIPATTQKPYKFTPKKHLINTSTTSTTVVLTVTTATTTASSTRLTVIQENNTIDSINNDNDTLKNITSTTTLEHNYYENDTFPQVGDKINECVSNCSENNLSAAGITGITVGCIGIVGIICGVSFIVYRNRGLNRPQVLNDRCSNPDSSGYIDDASIRDNSEEMYSLDNDSFLNSLEAMTIQNYWTDTVKHTKL